MDYKAALNKAPGSAPSEQPQGSPKPQPKKTPKNPPKEKAVEQVPAHASGADDTVDHTKVIAPIVRFELYVPAVEKEGEDDVDEEVLKAEAEEGDDVEATPGDASDAQKEKPAAPKASAGDSASRYFPVQVVATRRNRASELASYLLKKIDDKGAELLGGFRFFEKVNQKNSYNLNVKPISELTLDSVPQALRWVQAVIDILNNKQPGPIACGHNSFIHMNRIGETLKVSRTYGDEGNRRSEFLFKLEDFALRVREQAKGYVKAAQAVEDVIARRDRGDRDQANKTKNVKVSEKVNRMGFNAASKELKKLFGTTTALPKLSQKFQKQQQKKTQSKKQLQGEYKAMKALVLELVPKSFLEKDITALVPNEDEEPEVPEVKDEKPAAAAAPAAGAKKAGTDKKGQQQSQQNQQQQAAAGGADKKAQQPEKRDTPVAERKPRYEREKEDRALKFSSNPYDIGDWEVNPDKGDDETAVVPPKQQAAAGSKKAEEKKKQPQQQQKKPAEQPKAAEKPKQQQQQRKPAEKPKKQGGEKAATKRKAKPATSAAEESSSSAVTLIGGAGAFLVIIYLFYVYVLPQLQNAAV